MTSFVEAARREKLKELIRRGIAPYAYRFDRTTMARDAVAGFKGGDETRHGLAGRLVAMRPHGKTTFAHLEDASGKIQLYFKIDELGADAYAALELLDLGDYVGVEGPLFTTKTGEITVRVQKLTLLAKALRPLPLGKEDASGVKHGELSDPELRARQRYADLAVHPEVREVFRLRARVIAFLRRFLDARGYLEVETPVLQPVYGGAAARPFTTHYEALDATFYLRIADELYLKRCIVGGLERVYENAHDFRNEGMSRFHNPEFTMAEWYEAYADYHDMADLTEMMVAGMVEELFGTALLERHGATLSFARPFARKDYFTLVREHAGVDLGHLRDGHHRGQAGFTHEGAGDGQLRDIGGGGAQRVGLRPRRRAGHDCEADGLFCRGDFGGVGRGSPQRRRRASLSLHRTRSADDLPTRRCCRGGAGRPRMANAGR